MDKKEENISKNSENDSFSKSIKNLIYFNVVFAIIIGVLTSFILFVLFSFVEWIKFGLVLMVVLSITHLG
ncbi:MAG: hypothetical protein ACTSO9_03500 [Candidatus Helarchaeota archaeon]